MPHLNNGSMEKRIVTGIGEALWDMLPEGRKIGGAPANFAYHVSRFGLRSRVVSAVGDDALGQEILDVFSDKGLEYSIERVGYPTGTVQVELDCNGIPRYDIKEGVAWDNIPFTPALEEIARHTGAVCFGSLAQRSPVSRETISRFLDAMPADGDVLKVFDINLRQDFYTKDVIVRSLEKCNVLKINDEELAVVSGMFGCSGAGFRENCRMLLDDYGLRMLILTCGVKGSYVFGPDGESFMETPEVRVADTVGAGDSFTAAFVSSILKGASLRDAHKVAVEVSAYVCTCNGAMPALPERLVKL